MSRVRHMPNGIAGTIGDPLLIAAPMSMHGNVYYVSSVIGDSTNDGIDPKEPFAKLEDALNNQDDGDIIVLMEDHTEVITSSVTVDKEITIIGDGYADGKPTASLQTSNSSYIEIQENCVWRNIWFKEHPEVTGNATISMAGSGYDAMRMLGCYVEMGPHDEDFFLEILTGVLLEMKDCTFVSTGTSLSARPKILWEGNPAVMILDTCTFDDGDYGYTEGYCMKLSTGDAHAACYAENITALNGADFSIDKGFNGYFNIQAADGYSRCEWCAT